MRGVDESFGLVVAESRDVASGDAGAFGPGGSTSLRESLVVRASSVRKEKYCSSGGWWRHYSFQLLILRFEVSSTDGDTEIGTELLLALTSYCSSPYGVI